MRVIAFIVIVAIIVNWISYSTAQDLLPPQASEIFADGIEVISVEPLIDNTARKLYLYHRDSWHVYSYPHDFVAANRVPRVVARPDGSYLLIEQDEEYHFRIWMLDPQTGHFEQIERPCNASDETLNSLDYENLSRDGWVYQSEGEQVFLCSIVTGEMSDPLPEGGAWGAAHYGRVQPAISPDKQWLVLTNASSVAPIYPFRIYSYEVATGELRQIGELSGIGSDLIYFGWWIDNTLFTITATDMPEWSIRTVMIGDVRLVDSLHEGASRWRFWPDIDGTEVVFLPANMEDGPFPGPCFESYSDMRTSENQTYETGDLCDGGILIPDGSGDRLYRGVYPDASLVRFNPASGERTTLFVGEIESIGPISPGGRYLNIGLGTNSFVETDQDPDLNFGTVVEPDLTLIMDLTTGLIIGEFPANGVWYSDHQILVDRNQLLTIESGSFTTQSLPGTVQLIFPDHDQLVLLEESGVVVLYDFHATTTIPVLNSGYAYNLTYQTGGVLRITVARSSEEMSTVWHIRLP